MKQVTPRLPNLMQVLISLGLFLLLAFSFTAKLDLPIQLALYIGWFIIMFLGIKLGHKYKELEKAALADPYFAEKKLFPNVDFYSGIILEAMGFPTSMFTPIFALSRTVGWISQWKEQLSDPQLKIGRPRQLYQGSNARDYVDIEKR
mgnify:CR=1 FL=1